MTSPLLRLFAVFWWLLVAGSAGVAICGLLIPWEAYHSSREYAAYQVDLAALAKLPRATAQPPKLPIFYNTPEEALAALPMATVEPDATTDQQTQSAAAIRSAVDCWEASIQTRDPDYALLSGAVRRYAQALILERGAPRTPEQAVALVQAAYDEVKRDWGALPGKPVPDTDQPLLRGAAPAVPAPFVFVPDPVPPDPTWYVVGGAVVLLLSMLPFSIITVIRWIFTGRWRFGPRW